MKDYIRQLLSDLEGATQSLAWPYTEQTEVLLHDWKSYEEENGTAPIRNLPQWTGILPEMLPPATMLKDQELRDVLKALKGLLEKCNCYVVFQTEVPEQIQYEAIRQNFDQDIKVFQWNDGFFQFCKSDAPVKTCALGEYCQCAFFEIFFGNFKEENLTPEEERARQLQWEIDYLRRKHPDNWMKYYPYHLDKSYDDENGNPYNYGFDGDDEEEDNWWRK